MPVLESLPNGPGGIADWWEALKAKADEMAPGLGAAMNQIDFALRGEWYRGPKEAFALLAARAPATHAAFARALVPDADVPEHLGVPIDLVLVEATRDQLAAIRRVALPGSFASQLQGAILEQQRMPFDVKRYDAKVAEIDRRPREAIEQTAIARCTAGGARGR